MIYCDYNATAPVRPEVREAMMLALSEVANPSSVHGAGRHARRLVETARSALAYEIGGRAEDIVFTSGGTEANALAIKGALSLISDAVVLYTDLEHPAVKAAIEVSDAPNARVGLTSDGKIDLHDLRARLGALAEGQTPFLCLMLASNETGVIQPVADAARLVRDAGGLTHCDGVQGLGKLSVNVALLGVDYLALSAHKFGGPQGAGALWFRAGAPLKPVQTGGGQEKSLRSGTENVPGIAGFGAAVKAIDLADMKRVQSVRDRFEALIGQSAPVTFFGKESERLPNTSNFALEGFAGETQVMAMDLNGVAVSSGSACSSGKVRKSETLLAMGQSDSMAASAIRVSFGWASTLDDAERAASAWLKAARRAVPDAFKESA